MPVRTFPAMSCMNAFYEQDTPEFNSDLRLYALNGEAASDAFAKDGRRTM